MFAAEVLDWMIGSDRHNAMPLVGFERGTSPVKERGANRQQAPAVKIRQTRCTVPVSRHHLCLLCMADRRRRVRSGGLLQSAREQSTKRDVRASAVYAAAHVSEGDERRLPHSDHLSTVSPHSRVTLGTLVQSAIARA